MKGHNSSTSNVSDKPINIGQLMDVSSMNKSTTGFDKNDKNCTNENWNINKSSGSRPVPSMFTQMRQKLKDSLLKNSLDGDQQQTASFENTKKAITFNTENASTNAQTKGEHNRHGSSAVQNYTSTSQMNTIDTNPDITKAFIKRNTIADSNIIDARNASFRRALITGVRSSGFHPGSGTHSKPANNKSK